MQIRCNFPDISYLSETQKITFNSYNYNFFCFSVLFSIYNTYVFLNNMLWAKIVSRM